MKEIIERLIENHRLNESSEPCKGIFWFVREDDPEDLDIIYLDIPVDDPNFIGNSKNGLTYTHQRTWNDLVSRSPKSIRDKEWNYFPRGRVEIRNNRASIYLNPMLNQSIYVKKIVSAFNLSRIPYKVISDGSFHYKCNIED